jgi:thiol-disulfide isomerase/thioredoxin
MSDDPTTADTGTDAVLDGDLTYEERLEILKQEDVVDCDDLTLTLEFESTRGIYLESYNEADDEVYHQAVGDVFGLTAEEAAEYIAELDVTREEFSSLLALDSHFDRGYALVERAKMAKMVTEFEPTSPVPESTREIDNDSYGVFLDGNERAIVFVWKRFCAPCREMKEEFGATLSALPDDVAVAGVDGEATPAFCRAFGVEAAPSTLFFVDGEMVELFRGYKTPESVTAAAADVFGE